MADEIEDFVTFWAVPTFAVATIALWFLDRPGPWYRWKIACLRGLTAAGLGRIASQVVTHVWQRPRPFISHPHDTLLLVSPSHEPSFPSDHAVAAFAIALSVAFVGRKMGALFLAAATMVALSRVFVGLHYPGDIAGGALIGFVSAWIVTRVGGGRFTPLVRVLSRVSDPLVCPVWNALDRRGDRRRARRFVVR